MNTAISMCIFFCYSFSMNPFILVNLLIFSCLLLYTSRFSVFFVTSLQDVLRQLEIPEEQWPTNQEVVSLFANIMHQININGDVETAGGSYTAELDAILRALIQTKDVPLHQFFSDKNVPATHFWRMFLDHGMLGFILSRDPQSHSPFS
jgi:hypothetical protein